MRTLLAALAATLSAGAVACEASSGPARTPDDALHVAAPASVPSSSARSPALASNGENGYAASVKKGNMLALGASAVPFARYLNAMHNRVHPLFVDTYIASLHALPKDDPLNDTRLRTEVEIVLDEDGRISRMGVVKSSRLPAFDAAALDAFERAQPFGPAPTAIRSADGFVYIHWEMRRDEIYACSTMNARPFLLKPPPVMQGTTESAAAVVPP